jgi:hypothetical protein
MDEYTAIAAEAATDEPASPLTLPALPGARISDFLTAHFEGALEAAVQPGEAPDRTFAFLTPARRSAQGDGAQVTVNFVYFTRLGSWRGGAQASGSFVNFAWLGSGEAARRQAETSSISPGSGPGEAVRRQP